MSDLQPRLVGGLLASVASAAVARGRRWIPPERFWRTTIGTAAGFLSAAVPGRVVTVATLVSVMTTHPAPALCVRYTSGGQPQLPISVASCAIRFDSRKLTLSRVKPTTSAGSRGP